MPSTTRPGDARIVAEGLSCTLPDGRVLFRDLSHDTAFLEAIGVQRSLALEPDAASVTGHRTATPLDSYR